jgi:hypothetical protein
MSIELDLSLPASLNLIVQKMVYSNHHRVVGIDQVNQSIKKHFNILMDSSGCVVGRALNY